VGRIDPWFFVEDCWQRGVSRRGEVLVEDGLEFRLRGRSVEGEGGGSARREKDVGKVIGKRGKNKGKLTGRYYPSLLRDRCR